MRKTAGQQGRPFYPQSLERGVEFIVSDEHAALLRLVSAVLVEIGDKSASDTKACIKWKCQDA